MHNINSDTTDSSVRSVGRIIFHLYETSSARFFVCAEYFVANDLKQPRKYKKILPLFGG